MLLRRSRMRAEGVRLRPLNSTLQLSLARNLTSGSPEAGSRSPKVEAWKPLSSINRLQFFAGLEADRLTGRNRDFSAGARVASDAGLAGADIEHAKASQLNAMAVRQRLLHALKDSFHRQLGLGLGDAGSSYHFVDDVELNHGRPPGASSGSSLK